MGYVSGLKIHVLLRISQCQLVLTPMAPDQYQKPGSNNHKQQKQHCPQHHFLQASSVMTKTPQIYHQNCGLEQLHEISKTK